MTNPLQAEEIVYSGRGVAERLMTDACTIQRQAGSSMSEVTLVVTPTLTSVYTGKCRVKGQQIQDAASNAGERPTVTREYVVSIPLSTTSVQVDDLVTITASALDPTQVGKVLVVLGVGHGSQITARRIRCQEVTA